MDTNWLFQEPIDMEHKEYVLLNFLQKIDKNLNNFKLYPQFQEISLHLANVNLLLEKGQYLTLNRKLKDPDDEILLSDLMANPVPLLTKEEISELYNICKVSNEKLTDYFNHAKAIWDIVNDTVSINPILNKKNIDNKQGLFFLEYNGKTMLYEFMVKPIKKGATENKCHIKKVADCNRNEIEQKLKEVKRPLIKDIQDKDIHSHLIIFNVNHNNTYPLMETLLPVAKRKIMNYMIQSKVLTTKDLTNKK
jgi:hypothetical protein